MATTKTDPRVVVAMMPWFSQRFGNPHSVTHRMGHDAQLAVVASRKAVAEVINAEPEEIIFTSGATESNNIAIKGAARQMFKESGGKRRVIAVSAIEHKCVLNSALDLEKDEGYERVLIPVQHDGRIDMKFLRELVRTRGSELAIISVMAVNNDLGTKQDLQAIGALAHEAGALFHTDAAQGFGKMPIDVRKMNIDLLSISGHKIYGPKGIGALFVSRHSLLPGKRRVHLAQVVSGGGQEQGIRSGTCPTPLIVGLGVAAKIMTLEGAQDAQRIAKLSRMFQNKVMSQLPDKSVTLNGPDDYRYRWPGCVNLSFDCVEGESLMLGMDDVAVSSGSACTSATLEPSYVLLACGVPIEDAHTSIRFGIGRFTTPEQINYVSDKVVKTVNHLRDLSPLWEMKQRGIDLNSIQWAEDKHDF